MKASSWPKWLILFCGFGRRYSSTSCNRALMNQDNNKRLQLVFLGGWISDIRLSNEIERLVTKCGLKCWNNFKKSLNQNILKFFTGIGNNKSVFFRIYG